MRKLTVNCLIAGSLFAASCDNTANITAENTNIEDERESIAYSSTNRTVALQHQSAICYEFFPDGTMECEETAIGQKDSIWKVETGIAFFDSMQAIVMTDGFNALDTNYRNDLVGGGIQTISVNIGDINKEFEIYGPNELPDLLQELLDMIDEKIKTLNE